MKFILLIISLLYFNIRFLIAQEKGTLLLDGTFNFTSTTTTVSGESQTTTSFSIRPSVGIMLTPKIALGGYIEYATSNENIIVDETSLQKNNLMFGAFTRIHFPIQDKFYIYTQPYVAYGLFIEEVNFDKNSTFLVGGNIGFLYFFSKKFSMNLTLFDLSYSTINAKITGYEKDFRNDFFNFNTLLDSPTLGISLYL